MRYGLQICVDPQWVLTVDTNVVFDHLLRRKVNGPLGPMQVDVRDLAGWAGTSGVRFVLTSTVCRETSDGLVGAIYDAFGARMSPYKLKRMVQRAEKNWDGLAETIENVNPPGPAGRHS